MSNLVTNEMTNNITKNITNGIEINLRIFLDKICNKYQSLNIDRGLVREIAKELLGIEIGETRREFLQKEWDPNNEKNFSHHKNGSNFKAKWICNVNPIHKWEASVNNRSKGIGCPFCSNKKIAEDYSNSLFVLNSSLTSEFDSTNTLTAKQVSISGGFKAKWVCRVNPIHKWEAAVFSRSKGTGCPFCAGRKISEDHSNSLFILNPSLASEFDSSNNLTSKQVSIGSDKIVKWICNVNPVHKWEASICSRTNGNNCPFCSNKKIAEDYSNSLFILNPSLASELDSTNELTAKQISINSGKIVKWICNVNPIHKWEARIFSRTNGSGCPFCNESKGEKFINKYLTENNIEFSTQYKISYNECSNLRFDFYIEKYNTLIEFDGVQHFDIVSHFGDEYDFAVRVRNDNYKNSYCRENDITLIRIHYLDINDTSHLADLISQIDIENPRIIISKNYPENWVK